MDIIQARGLLSLIEYGIPKDCVFIIFKYYSYNIPVLPFVVNKYRWYSHDNYLLVSRGGYYRGCLMENTTTQRKVEALQGHTNYQPCTRCKIWTSCIFCENVNCLSSYANE